MRTKIKILFAILTLNFSAVYSQNWFPNENQDLNFYEMQKKFNDYWKDRTIEKGKGYKQFKRWENYWEHRVKPDGSFYPAGITQDNFNEYLRSKDKSNRSVSVVSVWEGLGPSSTSGGYAGTGRINALAFHPTNSNIIFAGAAGGGLWQSNNGGTNWFTNTDNLATLGVSSILIDPANPNVMYLGTGDGDGGDNYSVGVLKSTDGGVTFNTTGLNWTVQNNHLIRKMVFDPDNSNIILAATSNGIYRTINAGANWTQVQSGNFQDLEAKTLAASNTFYASSGDDIYRSTNDGVSWTNVQSISNTNRIALAVTPGNTNYVYALCSRSDNNGYRAVYRSIDSGNSFTQMSNSPNVLGWNSNGNDTGGQGWYDLVIAADPVNANTIHIGGVNHWKSIDGGTTWTISSHWSGNGAPAVHADKHALEWQNNTTLWEGNDGGVYKTINGGTSWIHLGSGLVTSQMYKLGVSQTDAKVITGLQDNGTKYKNNAGNWSDHIGGDGMECAIQPNLSSTMYASLYYGNFQRTNNSGNNWNNISGNIPGNPSGNWITPFLVDPSTPNTIYAGYAQVYKSLNKGDSWTSIGNFSSNNLNFMAISPNNSNYIYAGRSNNIWRTTNGGGNWSDMSTPNNSTVMMAVSPLNPDIIWAVCSNYSAGQKVYKSINGGSTWTNISGSLPNIPANCIVYFNDSDDGLYVGMDIGVYYKDNSMSDWELVNEELPNVEITELEINYSENKIYAATYGRGLWSLDLEVTCEKPKNLMISEVTPFAATCSWDNILPPANGYEWHVSTSATPPASGTQTTATSAEAIGLISDQLYYFYVRANCGDGGFSNWSIIDFKHRYACSGTSFDSGGSNGDYDDNEEFTTVLCPEVEDIAVRLTFSMMDIENEYDALYIHNGHNIEAPIFSSGNPATQSGFPPGGFYGNSVIGPFTSTDTSGCLTLHFLSDESVTEAGWAASLSCTTLCGNQGVTNLNGDGWGSLKRGVSCASPNDTLDIAEYLSGELIVLNEAILIDKNLFIIQSPSNFIKIKANGAGPVFSINPGFALNIANLELYGGTGNKGRAIFNSGTLNMTGVKIFEDPNAPSSGSSVFNTGTINIFDSVQINE